MITLFDEGIKYGMSSYHIFPNYKLAKDIEEADLVLLGGGSDISPNLYDSENVACEYINRGRDLFDLKIYDVCRANNIPILGICRGAQFLNVMNGGSMIQDISGHTSDHKMMLDPELIDNMDFEMVVSSTHHQMMVPHPDGVLLGYSLVRNHLRDKYDQRRIAAAEVPKVDPEIVFYPSTRSLCVQFHPEYYDATHQLCKFVQNLCEIFLGVKHASN